jgi:hypothetical protein
MIEYELEVNEKLFIFSFDLLFEGYENHIEEIMNAIWQDIIKIHGQSIQYETLFLSNRDNNKLIVEVQVK